MSLFGKVGQVIKGAVIPRGSTSCVEKCPRDKRCPKWLEIERHYKTEGKPDVTRVEGYCADVWVALALLEVKDAILGKIKKEE